MTGESLLVERRGAVVLLTLHAPHKRNAIDRAMIEALHSALDRLRDDDSVGALVVTGAGEQAFAAGADIAELRERRAAQALAGINARLFARIEEFPVPVVAAIRGHALGGGCELAIACDLRIAGESAKLGQPEVKLGIIPGAGATSRLPRLVGAGRARELILTGRVVDARTALAIGLVNEVVADAEVVERALAVATEITQNGRLAVRLAKAALNALVWPAPGLAGPLESFAQAVLFDSDEKRARMTAFLERGKGKSP
jgi:enoyl-CoA hydratase